jgi:hypothetical protein
MQKNSFVLNDSVDKISQMISFSADQTHKKHLGDLFKKADVNQDGRLQFEESLQLIQEVCGTQLLRQQSEEIFRAIDRDNSGYWDYREFVEGAFDHSILELENSIESITKRREHVFGDSKKTSGQIKEKLLMNAK